ncbi:MAG: (d)CMP kinase [Planctomycetota bacterium]|jgi:cytidylate kinase
MADLVITIDGPAGSGKSTVARLLAARLRAKFLDTGAMYRAVTLAAMRAGVERGGEEALLKVLDDTEFSFSLRNDTMLVSINGVDVTEDIRRPEVTANTRYAASAAKVRERLVEMQREFAAGAEKIVSEGRDQGTVVFGDADFKFFLTASAGERARRRRLELEAKGAEGSLEEIQSAIEARDESDVSRAFGPLRPAKDAIVIDTTDLNAEEVVEKLMEYVAKDD